MMNRALPSPSQPRPAGAAPDGQAKDTYLQRLFETLGCAPNRVFVKRDGVSTRGGMLLDLIFRYARALDAHGIGRGDVVALLARNGIDAIAIRYAANWIGAGACFLSVPSSRRSLSDLIDSIDPSMLVLFQETAALVPRGCELPLAGVGFVPEKGFDLERAAADQSAEPFPSSARAGDLAVIISSGGSTGTPKASWRTFESYSRLVSVQSPADRRQLINAPLAYLSQVLVDITLLGGGVVVFQDAYDAPSTASMIEKERITDLFLVEPQLFDLMDHPRLIEVDLSSLRTLTHIGASAPPSLRKRARERFGPRVVHAYGASEEGIVCSTSTGPLCSEAADLQSAGRVLPGVEVRIRDEHGNLCGPGEPGAIEVRSPSMAQGYFNRPELQASAFRDGWFGSGDIGLVEADGTLRVLGRAEDAIFMDGRLLTLTAIEEVLVQLPDVRFACVVRDVHRNGWIAVVLPWSGKSVDLARCRCWIDWALGPVVERCMHILAKPFVPLTEQGKPDRSAIQHLAV